MNPAQERRLERLKREHVYDPTRGRSKQTPTRAHEAHQAEQAYRDQLHAWAGLDYDGRMKTPPVLQKDPERFGGRRHARGTSGLYDWFYELAPAEQQRIRANWMSPQGYPVDELEDKCQSTNGYPSPAASI